MATKRLLKATCVAAIVLCTYHPDDRVSGAQRHPRGERPRYSPILPLAPSEGVFAYARIAPDASHLAYAALPSDRADVTPTVQVVNLRSKKITFSEPGVDAYWSNDGSRLIFMSKAGTSLSVSVLDRRTGVVARDVAPAQFGDYFSWSRRDGRDLILTILNYYYYLDGSRAVLPPSLVTPCPGIGAGSRPLISKDGFRITTFVRGTVVVRNLTDCAFAFDTNIHGAKADFSYDSRYIAFHAPKSGGAAGYDIHVVDLAQRTVRILAELPGSSFFPSWTADGRLCFRYDSESFRGFMMVENVLSAAARPLPTRADAARWTTWSDIFAEAEPGTSTNVVLAWSSWSAHSADALAEFDRTRRYLEDEGIQIGLLTALEPSSRMDDAERLLKGHRLTFEALTFRSSGLVTSYAANQMPMTMLFRNHRLVERRLGAPTFAELRVWLTGELAVGAPSRRQ